MSFYSFEYLFLNGEELNKEDKNKILNEINTRYVKGESFKSIRARYAPKQGISANTMINIEQGLMIPEMLHSLQRSGRGRLFVARVSQSYFIC